MSTKRRGALNTEKCEMVSLWIPKPLLAALDTAIRREDSDRSKFIRRAVRERVERAGIAVAVE